MQRVCYAVPSHFIVIIISMVFHMATSRIIISTLELITVTIVLKRIMRCVYARKVVVGFEGGSRITGGCLDAEF